MATASTKAHHGSDDLKGDQTPSLKNLRKKRAPLRAAVTLSRGKLEKLLTAKEPDCGEIETVVAELRRKLDRLAGVDCEILGEIDLENSENEYAKGGTRSGCYYR